MSSLSRLFRLSYCLLFLATVGGVVSPNISAQSATETKIRLMADALRARDSGDYELAQRNLLKLSEIAPEDPAVKRLLKDVQADLAEEQARLNPPAPAPSRAPTQSPAKTPVPADPFEPLPSLPDPMIEIAAMEAEIEAAAAAEETRQLELIAAAREQAYEAEKLIETGRFDAAIAQLDGAIWSMPENPLTAPVIAELTAQRADVVTAQEMARRLAQVERAPVTVAVSTPMRAPDPTIEMWADARAAYGAGRLETTQEILADLLALDPSHRSARRLSGQITDELRSNPEAWRQQTRSSLISEVEQAWRRPGTAAPPSEESGYGPAGRNPLLEKLDQIQIPSVSFSSVELQRVVSTLSDLSREFDSGGGQRRGVNIIVIDPQDRRPTVSLTLRDLSLKRVLDFITDSIGYQYEVQADAIVMRPGGETSTLDTEFFPITRSTVIRMTGIGGGLASGGNQSAVNDPFSPAPVNAVNAPGGGTEAEALKQFLQQAGVDFLQQPGSNLAYDGSAMIVTQTTRNVERIRNILNRYNDVRQVEIEAKFMEVQEGALEELGVNWGITRRGVAQFNPGTGAPVLGNNGQQIFVPQEVYGTDNRALRDAFSGSVRESSINIDGVPVASLAPPSIPGASPLGSSAGALADITGTVGEFDVNAVVRALNQMSGTDLLSAPRVTVLSGNPANITVAQEMRYPTSYGEIQSEVGRSGSSRDGESAGGGVTITAGTPQDFETRNVGVELSVTPTVEEDDYSISLDLNPRVTEFEGFVEYGGPSVAITGNRTVTVPPGFYQPIFAVRELSTKVTIWDGATLIMGGLTREEVKIVDDRVPFIGDIPGLGRLFRSKSESSQKRNLLIFVTANLVSPGGSPKKQEVGDVGASSLFQNPTLVTPAGAEVRDQK